MRNDKPAVVDLSEMQHDHSSAEQGGAISLYLYLSGYVGILDDDVICIVWTIPDGVSGTIEAGLAGAAATCEAAPTGDVECELSKNSTPIGSLDFAATDFAATFTFASDVGVVGGDRVRVRTPSPVDATFAGLSATLRVRIT